MRGKKSTLVDEVLFWLRTTGDILSVFLASKHEWKKRMLGRSFGNYNNYKATVYYLKNRGLVKFINKDGRKFLKLTEKGQMQALLAKAKIPQPIVWDKKWRVIVFDIPEGAKQQRNQFRRLLKENNFLKLQASVYISPYPFNREAVIYLKQTGLMEFIRMLKVEEMDSDVDIKKKFNLKG